MRRWLGLLMLVVFAARCLVPAGMMLQASAEADGSVAMVICTSHGAQTVPADADGTPVPKSAQADSICPYAAAGNLALAPLKLPSIETTVFEAQVTYALTSQTFRATPKTDASSARGPPSRLI